MPTPEHTAGKDTNTNERRTSSPTGMNQTKARTGTTKPNGAILPALLAATALFSALLGKMALASFFQGAAPPEKSDRPIVQTVTGAGGR